MASGSKKKKEKWLWQQRNIGQWCFWSTLSVTKWALETSTQNTGQQCFQSTHPSYQMSTRNQYPCKNSTGQLWGQQVKRFQKSGREFHSICILIHSPQSDTVQYPLGAHFPLPPKMYWGAQGAGLGAVTLLGSHWISSSSCTFQESTSFQALLPRASKAGPAHAPSQLQGGGEYEAQAGLAITPTWVRAWLLLWWAKELKAHAYPGCHPQHHNGPWAPCWEHPSPQKVKTKLGLKLRTVRSWLYSNSRKEKQNLPNSKKAYIKILQMKPKSFSSRKNNEVES